MLAPNEGRRQEDMPPVEGGDTPFLQEQQWPISVLANRTLPAEAVPQLPAPPPSDDGDDGVAEEAEKAIGTVHKGIERMIESLEMDLTASAIVA
jgi:hypothetical protein